MKPSSTAASMSLVTTIDTNAVNRFDPTAPQPKPSRSQRLLAALLLVVGAGVIGYGLTLDWLTISFGAGEAFGFDIPIELPETQESVWDAVPESGWLLVAAGAIAIAAAAVAVASLRPTASERAAKLADLLASVAAAAAGLALVLTYLKWSDLATSVEFGEILPISLDLEVGLGIWVTVIGAALICGGLTLHLARVKSSTAPMPVGEPVAENR